MGKLVPLLFLVAGIGAGAGAGMLLAPEPVDCPVPGNDTGAGPPEGCPEAAPADDPDADPEAPADFVRMPDQFVIPILSDGVVRALVVMSLSLEVDPGATGAIFAVEPKLRDGLLRALFDHANTGGFTGAYTAAGPMERLRRALLETAVSIAGPSVRDVLILDLLRQDS